MPRPGGPTDHIRIRCCPILSYLTCLRQGRPHSNGPFPLCGPTRPIAFLPHYTQKPTGKFYRPLAPRAKETSPRQCSSFGPIIERSPPLSAMRNLFRRADPAIRRVSRRGNPLWLPCAIRRRIPIRAANHPQAFATLRLEAATRRFVGQGQVSVLTAS